MDFGSLWFVIWCILRCSGPFWSITGTGQSRENIELKEKLKILLGETLLLTSFLAL